MNNPVSIYDIISRVESAGRIDAVRFEPTVYNRFAKPGYSTQKVIAEILGRIQHANLCSFGTACMIFSSSWGACQLMGFNIYGGAIHCANSVGEYLHDPAIQKAHFETFLTINGLSEYTPVVLGKQPDARLKFAIKYNGSIAYSNAIVAALKHYGVAVN